MAPDRSPGVDVAIRDEIRREGPMRFDRFMELALYGPGGYYDEPPVGTDLGMDFVTSPHVHPVFASFMAEAIRGLHMAMGAPRPFDLVEAGAGDGTLLRGLVAELDDLQPNVTAVERSRGARAALAELDGVLVAETMPESVDATIVLAHELLDNLPFRRLVGTADGVREVFVTLDDEGLVELLHPTEARPTRVPGDGDEVVVQSSAAAFVIEALQGPGPRSVLVIDYGAEIGAGGPAHGYAGHRVIEDLVAAPGATDITAGVDIGALAGTVETAGFHAFASVSQHDALLALGFEAWLHTELERQRDLLNTGRGAQAVGAWGGRSRAAMLVDPAGLGRFRWFVAATRDVAEPAWLADARRLSA